MFGNLTACHYMCNAHACRLCDDSSQYGLAVSHASSKMIDLEIHFPVIFMIAAFSSHMKSCFISNSDMLHVSVLLVSFTVFVKLREKCCRCTVMIVEIFRIHCLHVYYVLQLYGVLYLVERSTGNDLTKLRWSVRLSFEILRRYRKLRNAYWPS